MIGTLIQIVLVLIILGVLWWGLQRILAVFPIAEPFATIIHVVLVIIAVIVAIWIILKLLAAVGVVVPMIKV